MYQIYETGLNRIVVRVSDSAWIPTDPANTDYAAYLEWVAAGNTPEPWQPDASAPSTE